MKLTKSDRQILNLIQDDCRITNAQLSQSVNLSQSACHRRVKQLEDSGLIAGYRAQINRRALGLKLEVYVFVKLDAHTPQILEPFIATVRAMEEVISFHAISGSGDYILKVITEDMESYANIVLKKLVRIKGMRDLSSNFVLSTEKQNAPLPL